jgi:phosphohistidine phosphatase
MKSTLQTLLSNAVFLLGHNPGINELACDLLDYDDEHRIFEDFPPSTALIIDFEINQWAELNSNCGKLIDFITPGKFQIN